MQTFYPVATQDFGKIARVLDSRRLNKQALEGWQIMMTLLELDPAGDHRPAKGWKNHPAVKMWRGHEYALNMYVQAMVLEWRSRGYKSTIGEKAQRTLETARDRELLDMTTCLMPKFIDYAEVREAVASSHRLALLHKDYDWYSQFNWLEDTGTRPETYEYIWPAS